MNHGARVTEPYWQSDDERVTMHLGSCLDVMRAMEPASVDAVVTDPPYELGFMGRTWDASGVAFDPATWREVYRVLKPGAHLVAFGAPRNYHRLAVAIEDAGFELRDSLMWMYGSGFPKSLDVSKAIDKAAGAERTEGAREWSGGARSGGIIRDADDEITTTRTIFDAPVTDAGREWEGWGTALKPAYEPIVLARKPLIGTVAANVLAHGTGALNIDGTRIGSGGQLRWSEPRDMGYHGGSDSTGEATANALGRWPANVLLDEEAAALLDATVGDLTITGHRTEASRDRWSAESPIVGQGGTNAKGIEYPGDRGGPSRFFYTAKAPRSEREAGVELEAARRSDGRAKDIENPRLRTSARSNDHPTVKPRSVMAWLCRLITTPGGVVLDPFLGSGTTAMAALDEGMRCIGIDLDAHYLDIARQRVTHRHVLGEPEVKPPAEHRPQGRLL